MTLNELCKKYNLEVEEIDTNNYKVINNNNINLDKFMNDIGECSIVMSYDVEYKKFRAYSYKFGRLYAFTTEPDFSDLTIEYKNKLIDNGIKVCTERNVTLTCDVINIIG